MPTDMKLSQNTGAVQEANGNMSLGQINAIRNDALATVIEGKEAVQEAQDAEKAATSKSSTEAGLYGDIAVDALAPGLRLAKNVTDFVGARERDKAIHEISASVDHTGQPVSTRAVSIDDTSAMMRKPGLYRSEVGSSVYGGAASKSEIAIPAEAVSKSMIMTSSGKGGDLMDRAGIAKASLLGQGENLKTWDTPPEQLTAGVAQTKQMAFEAGIANEQALNSTVRATQEHSAKVGYARQMAPGMDMGLMNGPKFRGEDIIREARETSDQQGSWAST